MRIRRIAVLALALAIALAGVAIAGWKTGRYKGKTEGSFVHNGKVRKGHISFTVKKHEVKNFNFEIRLACPDGSHTNWTVGIKGSLPLDKDGYFKGTFPTGGGTGQNIINGKVHRRRAKGNIRRFDKEDPNTGAEDPNGYQCDSGTVRWHAKRKKPKR